MNATTRDGPASAGYSDGMGNAGTALLLHGVGSGPATLWRIREWLEGSGWTVEDAALLGHGGREAAPSHSLDAFVADVLPHGDFDLVVGHSLGGTVALHATTVRPGWTKRLILVEPAIRLDEALIEVAKPSELAELRWTSEEIAEHNPRWDARDVEAKLAEAARARPETVAGLFDENRRLDLEDEAARVAVPTLVITGDRTTNYSIIDESTWRRLEGVNPRLEFVPVPGTGHSPHRDAPSATRAIMLGWLGTTA